METGKANNFISESFNISLYDQYRLSVQISDSHLSYCIIDSRSDRLELLKRFNSSDLINLLNSNEVLKSNFKSTSVNFVNFPSTIIPLSVFSKDNVKEILELNSEVLDIILTDKLNSIDAYLAYTIPAEINEIARTFFPNANKKSQQTVLIDNFSKEENSETNAYLNLTNKIVNITIYKAGKLISNNSFKFITKEDLLYFTLFSFEQLKIETETVEVQLYGDITKGDEYFNLLYNYIRNLSIGEIPNKINIPANFEGFEAYKHFSLLVQWESLQGHTEVEK